jgi:uncharacterized protein YecE (DUF72 family)
MTDQPDLFGSELPDSMANPESRPEWTERQRSGTQLLARHGIYLGTSSWKYPGWCGLIYSESRYTWRGKFSGTRFNRSCLAEYAETFRSVCVDGVYYQFPSEKYLTGLADQVPGDFRFSFKVTGEITQKTFPNISRMGNRAGRANPNFLNAELFERRFLAPCNFIRSKVGLLMFEFSRFSQQDFAASSEFLDRLDNFLGRLPKGWDYGTEIRNEDYLDAEYLTVLQKHGVAHVYNSWDAMPALDEQMERIGDALDKLHSGARFLLKPGRSYSRAVEKFSPYRNVKEVYEIARKAGALLIRHALKNKQRLYLYGNNRLEGCSPITLMAILDKLPAELLKRLS